MANLDDGKIRTLLAKGKYKEAGSLLDEFVLIEKKNDAAWYLLGILAMKLKNYEQAHEYFARAATISRKADYLLFDGLAYLENLDVHAAENSFSECLKINQNDPEVNFYMAICYLLEGDTRSGDYLKRAYRLDRDKTKRLLRDFFHEVIENNPIYSSSVKEQIRKELN